MEMTLIGLISSIVASLVSGIILILIRRNQKNTDEKLAYLAEGQNNMQNSIGDMLIKINDTENKTRENHVGIKELKAETKEKFKTIEDRVERQGKSLIDVIGNLKEIQTVQKICMTKGKVLGEEKD